MTVIAASFVVYFGSIFYADFLGVRPLGIGIDYSGGRMRVGRVDPGTRAERAGVKAGDWIVAAEGQEIHYYADWKAIGANARVGQPFRLEIERQGERLQVSPVVEQTAWSSREPRARTILLVNRVGQLVMLSLAFLIAFSRPRDLVACLGALFLATVAISQEVPAFGSAATLRNLPRILEVLMWIPGILCVLLFPIFFTFCAMFPRKLFHARWLWIVLLAPGILAAIPLVHYAFRITYQPERVTGLLPDWMIGVWIVLSLAYTLSGLAAMIANYRRLEHVNEKRRVRVLLAGSTVGWSASLPWMPMILPGFMSATLVNFFNSFPYLLFSNVLVYLVFPLSFAYPILRHRLFDIRVMIRQGLQYALARRLVLSMVPALGAVMILDIVLHGDQPLLAILSQRGWVYFALAGLALTAHLQQKNWLKSLDRRFFRERYDAQKLLRDVVEEVRQAPSFDAVAPHVVAKVETALHPEFAALLVREMRQPAYNTLAAAPAGQAPLPLPADSKLISLVRLLGRPMEMSLSQTGWLREQLPHEDTDFLRQCRIDLLVPIPVANTGREAFLALGRKRSEEPYSREDVDLLQAIASSLALLLERPMVQIQTGETFEQCPQCGACYDAGVSNCAQDGRPLLPILWPRLIANRYCLDRRLGQGGMGTVYEATDTALERRVAVKVIRDDRVGTFDAAERFRREARAAAAFSHPNVVTVHDFGVVAGTRAFLVMELLRGKTLREELREHKRLPPQRTLEILRGVGSAVQAAHDRHLLHRDLKPENIFLVRHENTEVSKVLDFGLAKSLDADPNATRDTNPGTLIGTYLYMSPEQMRGEPARRSWDLWALGVVAYEMLAGGQPFLGETRAVLQPSMQDVESTVPTRPLREVPPRWQEFFSRALSTEPSQRPASAKAFIAELENALV
jgi:tRNA A-37 threonylcarbamoyl transferase component Bud32